MFSHNFESISFRKKIIPNMKFFRLDLHVNPGITVEKFAACLGPAGAGRILASSVVRSVSLFPRQL